MMTRGIVQSLGVGRFLEGGTLSSRGAAGGVVVLWDNRLLKVVDIEVGRFSVSFRFLNYDYNVGCVFTGVCGATHWRERRFLGRVRGH